MYEHVCIQIHTQTHTSYVCTCTILTPLSHGPINPCSLIYPGLTRDQLTFRSYDVYGQICAHAHYSTSIVTVVISNDEREQSDASFGFKGSH